MVREEFNNFKVKVRFINNSFNRSFGVCIVKFRDVLGQRFKDSVKAVGGEEYGGGENKCLRDFCGGVGEILPFSFLRDNSKEELEFAS